MSEIWVFEARRADSSENLGHIWPERKPHVFYLPLVKLIMRVSGCWQVGKLGLILEKVV